MVVSVVATSLVVVAAPFSIGVAVVNVVAVVVVVVV